jgi:uncharacterized OsmC-like protein
MMTVRDIKEVFERNRKLFSLKPEKGRTTSHSTSRITSGLSCEVTEGPWKFTIDLPEGAGGENKGPTPGVLGRAAFGSCLAITCQLYARVRGLDVDHISVDVDADYDDAVMFRCSDERAGYTELRYTINITSNEPQDVIHKLIDDAEKAGAYLDIFRNQVPCKRELNIIKPS